MNIDIRLDIDNEDNPFELMFKDGDFQVYQSDEQNVRLCLLSDKGNWKQYPLIGAYIKNLLHSSTRTNYRQIVSTELNRIGYKLLSFGAIESSPYSSEFDWDLKIEEL